MKADRNTKKCILVGAGDLNISQIPVQEQDYVIAVDGGILYCSILGMEPNLWIGDFDSVGEEQKQAVEQIAESCPQKVVRLQPEKDDTDMLAAIRKGLESGYTEFHIYGGMGGRVEHTFANIQCLAFLRKQGARGYLMDGTGMITVIENETISFQESLEGYLSVFALGTKAEGVTITGMKYPLTQATIQNAYPIGVSNEFIGEKSSICVEDGQLVLMLTWAE